MNNKKYDFDEHYKREWRELGFYYDYDEQNHCWRFVGNKLGILNFCSILKNYISTPSKNNISEHEHYGPHSYLKIITWKTSIINSDGIFGTFPDLERLSNLISERVKNGESQIFINEEYSYHNESSLLINIVDGIFDPSELDKSISS